MEVESEDLLNESFERLLLDSDNETPLVASSDDEAALLVASNPNEDSEYSDEDNEDDDDGWKEEIVARSLYPPISVKIADEVQLLTEPMEFYELFTEKVWPLLVTETNRYAKQKGLSGWVDTDIDEIRRFFGLCLKMGQVKMPRLRDYWDTSGELTPTPVAASVMTRTRFENLLGNLHLADNTAADGKDRLFKIAPIISILNDQSEKYFIPGSSLCVDESLVPFRGRIVFRQYIPNKRYRYGIKLFKICGDGGYTCRTKVYAGKEACQNVSVSEKVVLELADKYLDAGRDVYTDNYYTGLPLAEKLIARKTNLIGTCRRNRKGLPTKVLQRKLKRGNTVACQKNGIMVLKYKDKRDILMLSTRHNDAHDGETQKPRVIEDYNKGKMYVDISDQMCSYTPFVRRTTKWYIRLLFHIVTQTMLINSWVLYKIVVGKIKLNDYKRKIFAELLNSIRSPTPTTKHKLEKLGPHSQFRRRCRGCYQKHAQQEDSKTACNKAKKVATRCSKCQTHFCLECFNTVHIKCSGQ